MLKSDLRKLYTNKRITLRKSEKEKLEENIYQQISKFDFSKINNIHLFLSIQKFNEINTQPIIEFFRKKEKKIIVSRCNFKDNSLSHFYLEENTKLLLNKFSVPEPINAEKVATTKIDLIFVPMLISDKKNYRVGYGKGFYDRFLAACRKDVKTIGLNFFPPIVNIKDINEFDIPLNHVVFPK